MAITHYLHNVMYILKLWIYCKEYLQKTDKSKTKQECSSESELPRIHLFQFVFNSLQCETHKSGGLEVIMFFYTFCIDRHYHHHHHHHHNYCYPHHYHHHHEGCVLAVWEQLTASSSVLSTLTSHSTSQNEKKCPLLDAGTLYKWVVAWLVHVVYGIKWALDAVVWDKFYPRSL